MHSQILAHPKNWQLGSEFLHRNRNVSCKSCKRMFCKAIPTTFLSSCRLKSKFKNWRCGIWVFPWDQETFLIKITAMSILNSASHHAAFSIAHKTTRATVQHHQRHYNTTTQQQLLVSLLIDWFITSMCLWLLLDLRNVGTEAAASSIVTVTAAGCRCYIYMYRYRSEVLLLTNLIKHIFYPPCSSHHRHLYLSSIPLL